MNVEEAFILMQGILIALKYIIEIPGIFAGAMSSLSIVSVGYQICCAIVWMFSISLGITSCVWVGLRHIAQASFK